MLPDFKSTVVRIYLAVGLGVCLLFVTGAIAGWKTPPLNFSSGGNSSGGYYSGRSSGGFGGSGK